MKGTLHFMGSLESAVNSKQDTAASLWGSRLQYEGSLQENRSLPSAEDWKYDEDSKPF